MQKVKVIIEKSKTGYAAYLPLIDGCVTTGGTIDELKYNMHEAIRFHREGMKKDGLAIPLDLKEPFELVFQFDVETFLCFYDGIFTRRALSRLTGINESLLSQYANGIKHPRQVQVKKIEKGLHHLAKEILQVSL